MGKCLNCGGYCDLQICSARCGEAWANRGKPYRTKCRECGAEDASEFSCVTRQCGACMDAQRVDRSILPEEFPARDEFGYKLATPAEGE